MKKIGRIGVRIEKELLDRFRNALAAHHYRMAHILDDLIEGWVLEQESRPFVWMDREDQVRTKEPGEPFPDLLADRTLPVGRPHEKPRQ